MMNCNQQLYEVQDIRGFRILTPKPDMSFISTNNYAKRIGRELYFYNTKSKDYPKATYYETLTEQHQSTFLFNSSPNSGFLYRINGCDDEGMNSINANASSFAATLSAIKDNYSLEYAGCRNDVFYDNLSLVDSRMDEIMQNAVLITLGYYGNCRSRRLTDICDELSRVNPLRHRHPEYFYAVNFKELLFDSFAGMTASSIWDGQKNLSGGYLDVSPDGTVLFYRAMSDSVFTNYLFTHTYMDFPDKGLNCELAALNARAALENRQPTEDEIKEASTTPSNNPKLKKGDWGYIYKQDDDYLIAINFQVRFK